MAIYSPLRLRRQAAQRAEVKQRLITFEIQSVNFALALDGVAKVTTLERLYGDAGGTGAIFTTYQGREIAAIDVGAKIFGRAPTAIPPLNDNRLHSIEPIGVTSSYSIVLQTEDNRQIGLPIDSKPSIRSIAPSAFVPLPADSNIACVELYSIEQSVDLDDPSAHSSSIYLLDRSLLMSV